MRRISWFFAVLLVSSVAAILSGAPAPTAGDPDGINPNGNDDTIWVVNRDRLTLMVFNAHSGAPAIPSPLGLRPGAHDLTVSHRARKAFVMNETDNSVSIFSAATFAPLGAIAVGPRPHHVGLDDHGRTAYVGLFGGNQIATIDTETDLVRQYASTGPLPAGTMMQAHAPVPSLDGRLIFVPHEVGNLVTAVNAETGAIEMSLNAGSQQVKYCRPVMGACMCRCAARARSS